MIFVTVGTHEQQFNRLVQAVDRLREDKVIEEEVIIQTGYSTYEPKFCKWSVLYPYQEMVRYVDEARIVITHGGPSSFIMPLQIGKVPVVVPRQKRFGEHVNNHQVEFCRVVKNRLGNIILVEDIEELPHIVDGYKECYQEQKKEELNHNKTFNEQLKVILKELGV